MELRQDSEQRGVRRTRRWVRRDRDEDNNHSRRHLMGRKTCSMLAAAPGCSRWSLKMSRVAVAECCETAIADSRAQRSYNILAHCF
jgi:hypothetical protein